MYEEFNHFAEDKLNKTVREEFAANPENLDKVFTDYFWTMVELVSVRLECCYICVKLIIIFRRKMLMDPQ